MAAKTSLHRYGMKLRHCHPMYLGGGRFVLRTFWQGAVLTVTGAARGALSENNVAAWYERDTRRTLDGCRGATTGRQGFQEEAQPISWGIYPRWSRYRFPNFVIRIRVFSVGQGRPAFLRLLPPLYKAFYNWEN